MKVRTFLPGDEPQISQLACITMDRSYKGMYLPQTIEGLKIYHNEENILADAEKGALIVVVEQDGEIIGTGTCSGTYVKRVFVHPDFHRCNIGNMVMDEIERFVATKGLLFIELFATLPSEVFYLKRGYTTIDLFYNPEVTTQVEYFRMIKPLVTVEGIPDLSQKEWSIIQCPQYVFLNDIPEPFRFIQVKGMIYTLFKTTTSNFAEIIGLFQDQNTIAISAHYVEFNKNWKSYNFRLSVEEGIDGRIILKDDTISIIIKES